MKLISCCIPLSWDFVPTQFFHNYLLMLGLEGRQYAIQSFIDRSIYLDRCRNNLVNYVLETKSEYFLWIDADQTYPKDTPKILMKHIDSGKSIVGGCTPMKRSFLPIMYMFTKEDHTKKWRYMPKDIVKMSETVRIDGMGMGGVMMRTNIFKKLEKPYFNTFEEDNEYVGEDVYFYRKCKDAGIDVWCDTSLKFGHMDLQGTYFNKESKERCEV